VLYVAPQIRFRWIRLCVRAEYAAILPLALKFITSQGRMKVPWAVPV
jgi:hypothetical protein